MRHVFFIGLLSIGSVAGQVPKNAVTKCVVSTDFWDTTSLGKKTTTVNTVLYYDNSLQILQERRVSRGSTSFSGVRYHYQDSLCVWKEDLGNPENKRDEFYLYKNNKLMTSLIIDSGPLKTVTDYQYGDHGLEFIISQREYENGILKSKNNTYYLYDNKGRNIQSVVLNNDDTSFIQNIYYDSILSTPFSFASRNKVFTFVETFISFDSIQRKEKKLSVHNGETLLEEENIFNDKHLLISRKTSTDGTVNGQEVFVYDDLEQLCRHEQIDKHDRKMVYFLKNRAPIAEETWFNGRLYSTVNYTYSPVPKRRS